MRIDDFYFSKNLCENHGIMVNSIQYPNDPEEWWRWLLLGYSENTHGSIPLCDPMMIFTNVKIYLGTHGRDNMVYSTLTPPNPLKGP